jgi:hypothetical protein
MLNHISGALKLRRVILVGTWYNYSPVLLQGGTPMPWSIRPQTLLLGIVAFVAPITIGTVALTLAL